MCVFTTLHLLFISIWISSTCVCSLAIMNNATVDTVVRISLPTLSFFGCVSRSEVLNYVVILCLIFWDLHAVFHIVCHHFSFSGSTRGFYFLHIFVSPCYFKFSVVAVLMSVTWCLLVILISVLLMIRGIKNTFFFICRTLVV